MWLGLRHTPPQQYQHRRALVPRWRPTFFPLPPCTVIWPLTSTLSPLFNTSNQKTKYSDNVENFLLQQIHDVRGVGKLGAHRLMLQARPRVQRRGERLEGGREGLHLVSYLKSGNLLAAVAGGEIAMNLEINNKRKRRKSKCHRCGERNKYHPGNI